MPNLQAQFVLLWLLFAYRCYPQTADSPADRNSATEQVRLSEILISTPQPYDPAQVAEAQHKAEQVRDAIRRGGTFADIARVNSQGPTAAQGGDIGCFTHGKLARILDELVFRMKVGDVSDVFRTKHGFRILEVSARGAHPCAGVENQSQDLAILTDTMGVDFGPYLARIKAIVRSNWMTALPPQVFPPISKQGKLSIEFVILKDGKISGMTLHTTSGDVALDRAAWASITASNPFPPLPTEFPGRLLGLRFYYFYNLGPTDIGISVSPSADVRVPAGATLQFSASGKGITDASVKWSVSGPGCSKSACGSISLTGLYTAPVNIPDPPTVQVEAASIADSTIRTCSTITVVQANPSH